MSLLRPALGLVAGVGIGLLLPRLLRKRGPRSGSTHAVRGGDAVRVPYDDLVAMVARCLEAVGAAPAHALRPRRLPPGAGVVLEENVV